MSRAYVNHVLTHSKTTGAARLFLLVIAFKADNEGVAHLSYQRLAADTGMSIRSIRRLLFNENSPIPDDELELCPGGSNKGGKRRMTQYRILKDHAPDVYVNNNKPCA